MGNAPFDTVKPLAGLIIVMIGFTFSSCKKEEKPTGILSEPQLKRVMVELYLAEARLNSKALSRDSALKLFKPFEEKYLEKMGIQDSVLQKTYQYYYDHPEELERVYDAVIDSLSLLEQKNNNKPRKPSENAI